MNLKIALVGNPNSGKTTLFNALTGSNQFVGNWPGVTVEKKEGKLKNNKDITITDLPGIYSLSPYTLEEVITRNYLIDQRPDAILNIVDGTNLERNLYLTTQLMELGIPIVIAINMMDIVRKNEDKINIKDLSYKLGCEIVEISALKGHGINETIQKVIKAAQMPKPTLMKNFDSSVERSISYISEAIQKYIPDNESRWYSIKIFERDEKVLNKLNINQNILDKIEHHISTIEEEMDDDSESIITNQRYVYISSILKNCYSKKNAGKLTISDKIDKIVTNRFAALPIFAVVMFLVYFISVTTIGTMVTDFTNDGLFGDGWHLFGIGVSSYEKASEEYVKPSAIIEAFEKIALEKEVDPSLAKDLTTEAFIYDDDGNMEETIFVNYEDYMKSKDIEEPDPASFGIYIPGVPVIIGNFLEKVNCATWLQGLILDGIVAGVGAVLGFVPQMLILFLFLAFLESCGYMARIAFVMDRIFRKFGLSGKSFIPMLIGTGCGVPGIMASRTIENDRDRKMTIITTTFIPCGAKLPIIALIAGAMFNGAWWVAPSAYFVGICAIIFSGIILKKTKMFYGNPAPFVMELPSYHMPTAMNILRSMWERGWSFIKKAGTIILLATVFVWFTSNFGWSNGSFGMVDMDNSILSAIGSKIAWIFIPLGWGNWQGAVASITGLIAKENVVGTFGVLFGGFNEVSENGWQIWAKMAEVFTPLQAYSFLIFNLLCAPCFAAIGAIKREMNNAKWTAFAIGYQCLFAYIIAFIVYQIGSTFAGNGNVLGSIIAVAFTGILLFLLFKPDSYEKKRAFKIEKEAEA